MKKKIVPLSELVGKTIKNIDVLEDNTEMVFTLQNGERYIMYHERDFTEHVSIEDINGDLKDLIGSPILLAEERIKCNPEDRRDIELGHETWTFYTFATIKGYVTIRWYGESEGYYSETVDFAKMIYE